MRDRIGLDVPRFEGHSEKREGAVRVLSPLPPLSLLHRPLTRPRRYPTVDFLIQFPLSSDQMMPTFPSSFIFRRAR
jgi:hypothetical protein